MRASVGSASTTCSIVVRSLTAHAGGMSTVAPMDNQWDGSDGR